jgi:hypothetical protein
MTDLPLEALATAVVVRAEPPSDHRPGSNERLTRAAQRTCSPLLRDLAPRPQTHAASVMAKSRMTIPKVSPASSGALWPASTRRTCGWPLAPGTRS